MVAGIVTLGLLHNTLERVEPERTLLLAKQGGWVLLMTLLTLVILRRSLLAIANPSPQKVQFAVKNCILSIITLDAAIVLDTSNVYCAMGVLALLVPTLVAGRWVYST